jgi:uncharacterized membrane protein
MLKQADHGLLKGILERHELRLFRFAGALSEELRISEPEQVAPASERITASEPTGLATNLAGAIRGAFEACTDAHLAAIILVTDGQPTQQDDWDQVARLATSRGAPLFALITGSTLPPPDLALERVHMPQHAYVRDNVSCAFRIQTAGLAPQTPLEVLIRNRDDSRVLASGTFVAGASGEPVEGELLLDPLPEGRYELFVEARPVPGELLLGNNTRQVLLDVVEDRTRVLYVDGYPRFEYRFLKNTLLREPSVVLSSLLLSADEGFIQEGDEPIRRFPVSEEELAEYDVILLGDVDPRAGWITSGQLDLVADFVARHGGGLGFIAGERFCPQHFQRTPLESLLPVDPGGQNQGEPTLETHRPYKPQPTAAGRESPILRILNEDADREAFFERLPAWHWASAVRGLRPGAEVLLEHPTLMVQDQHIPLLAVKRHGAGLVLYQGSDDSWRWRRQQGEGFFDAYWLQIVRALALQKQFPQPAEVTLRPSRTVVDPQDTVTLSLTIDDVTAAAQLPDRVQVQVRQAGLGALDQVELRRLAAGSQHFQGTFQPRGVGQFEVVFETSAYGLAVEPARTVLEVQPQWLEQRQPQANRALLEELAERTGGRVFEPQSAQDLPPAIPARRFTVPNDLTESLWDSKLALLLAVPPLMTEWILRKRRGLT